jgi:cytochrome c5
LVFASAILLLAAAGSASACPYESEGNAAPKSAAHADEQVAAHSAHGADLLGANCPFATGLMARRVIAEGRDWSWQGALARGRNDLGSRVAAPLEARGAGGAAHLVATELLETLVASGNEGATLTLQGRSLDLDGTTYVVLTSFRAMNP